MSQHRANVLRKTMSATKLAKSQFGSGVVCPQIKLATEESRKGAVRLGCR